MVRIKEGMSFVATNLLRPRLCDVGSQRYRCGLLIGPLIVYGDIK